MNSINKKFFWSFFSIFLLIEALSIFSVNFLPSFKNAYVWIREYLAKFPDLLRWFESMIARETIEDYLVLILTTAFISVLISLIITVLIFISRDSAIEEKSRNPMKGREVKSSR